MRQLKFNYTGRDKNRKVLSGIIEAPSSRDAIILLKREHGLVSIASLKRKIEIPIIEKLKARSVKAFSFVSQVRSRFSPRKIQLDVPNANALEKLIEKIKTVSLDDTSDNESFATIDIFIRKEPPQETYIEDLPKPKLKTQVERKARVSEHKLDWSLLSSERKTVSKSGRAKIPKKDIDIFTRRLATMLGSGIPLSKALTLLQDTKNKHFKAIIGDILKDVQQGSSLSAALSKFPKQFDTVYVALVSVGESSGTLTSCLKDILLYQEEKNKIAKKVKSAMVYPSIVLIVVLALLLLGSVFFIPMFKGLFESLGMQLPLATKILFWVADKMVFIIGVPFGALFVFGLVRKTNKRLDFLWRATKDRLLLKIPIIKDQLITTYMYYFVNTLGIILKNGVKMLDGIKLTEGVIDNLVIKSEIRDAADLIVKGASLSEALSEQPHFDPVVCNIIYTGEESGKMHAILEEISEYYQEMLTQRTEMLVEMVQPASIMIIAAIVVPVVLALFFPILDLATGKFMNSGGS